MSLIAHDFGVDENAIEQISYTPTTRDHHQFEQAVQYIMPAMERAGEKLDEPDSMTTGFDTERGVITLSHDDWFTLRGLLLCARFGACTEKWPPWFNRIAKRHWLAWKAQGRLAPSEARRRFVAKVAELPGYSDLRGASASFDACWTLVCPIALPCTGFSLCGLVAIRFTQPPPRTPTLEEAEASRRKKLLSHPLRRGKPGTLEGFCGQWRHVKTENMEAYLKAFGVGVLGRKTAMAFVPEPLYHVHLGKLCITMNTPLGTRVEWLTPDGPPEKDRDPAGNNFMKTVKHANQTSGSAPSCCPAPRHRATTLTSSCRCAAAAHARRLRGRKSTWSAPSRARRG